MKHKTLINAVFISLVLAVALPGCGLFQKPKQEPAPPEDEQAAYWENPWENLPVVSRDGSGTVGADGGVVWLGNAVAVRIPRDLFDERENVEVNVRVEDFDPSLINLNTVTAQDVPEWTWGNKQIAVTISNTTKYNILLPDIYTNFIIKTFINSINNQILDILSYNKSNKLVYAAASYIKLESAASLQVAAPSVSTSPFSTYAFIFRATPVDVVRDRCESAGGKFVYGSALPFAPPPGEVVNYVCVPPIGKVWDRISQSMISKNRWQNPAMARDFTLLTANVGSFFGQYSLSSFRYKLSYASVAQRIANNISIIQPDIITFQEVFDKDQISNILDLAVYSFSCAEYLNGSSYECIAWKKDLAGNAAMATKTVVGGTISGESSFSVYCDDDDDEDDCVPASFNIDFCASKPSGDKNRKDTGAHLISLNFGEHVLQVASIHTATAGIQDARYCREQQLLTLLINSEVARFAGGQWSSTHNSPPTLFAGDYNIDPQRGGAGIVKTFDDMYRLRWLADWSGIDASFDEPDRPHPLVEPKQDYNLLTPWRSENDPTAFPSKQSFDHVLSLPGFFSGQICEVLDGEHRLDANYWWVYNSTEHTYGFGGMDHRAVLCGFDFAPYFDANLSSNSLEVPQGGSATVRLYITPKADFSGDINVRLVNRVDGETTPAGIEINPTTISADALSTSEHELTITANSTAAPASYDLELLLSAGSVVRSVVLGLSVVPSSPGAEVNETEWGLVTGPVNDVVYANGIYVAVGSLGTIFSSTDGREWFRQTPIPNYSLGGVVYGDRFVAVGSGGTILTSSDGRNWSLVDSPVTDRILDIAYGDGKYVAVGDGGLIVISQDGVGWTSVDSGTTDALHDIAYGNGNFVAISENGKAFVSSNGIDWIGYSTGTTARLYSIVYGDSGFVAVGYGGVIIGSPDGTSWDSRGSATMTLYGVGYGNGTYVAVGWGGRIYTSSDAVNWSESLPGPSAAETLICVGYGNSEFVALGEGSRTLLSSDGYSWTEVFGASTKYWDVAADAYGNIVAVGESGNIIAMRSDGSGITQQTSNVTTILYSVTYAASKFIAVGEGGTILIATPDSGLNLSWETRDSRTSADLWDAAYGNGKFVVVGSSDTIVTSIDGVTWGASSTGSGANLRAVTFGDGIFVAAGSSGTVFTSSDGVSWATAASATSNGIYDVIYAGNQFVAVGSNGTILTSQDGTNWYSRTSGTGEDLYSVAYANGILVAVGGSTVAPGVILVSRDGVSWNVLDVPVSRQLLGVTYANGRFTAVGNWGEIIQSQ